jgi:hypothetical protein
MTRTMNASLKSEVQTLKPGPAGPGLKYKGALSGAAKGTLLIGPGLAQRALKSLTFIVDVIILPLLLLSGDAAYPRFNITGPHEA